MGTHKLTVETTDDVPGDVLVEHVRWAVEELTKETGDATVTLDSPNPRSHPFEGGVEVFDDHDGTKGFATGGYIPAGTHLEGDFSDPGYVIPRQTVEKLGGDSVIGRALQALRDKRNTPREV